MSLTSIIDDNQALRDKLKTEFARPAFNLKTDIKAVPLTNNNGIVGTAFDYLLRFYLQHHNKSTFIQRETWNADDSYKKLINFFSKSDKHRARSKIIIAQYDQTKTNYSKYISDGHLTDSLIANTIFLAKLESYFRGGSQNIDNHDPEDVKDLRSLISLVDKTHFTAKHRCYLNPTFGEGSILVDGADADLIIDNTLIDIKTIKHLKLEREHLDQILCYYILSLIGGVNNNPNEKPIENIGLYFARHGELWTLPIHQFGDKRKFEKFKNWFISYVSKEQITLEELKESFLSLQSKTEKLIKEVSEKKIIAKKAAKKATAKKTT